MVGVELGGGGGGRLRAVDGGDGPRLRPGPDPSRARRAGALCVAAPRRPARPLRAQAGALRAAQDPARRAPAAEETLLLRRLRRLDPAAGTVPDETETHAVLPAASWVLAGASLEQVPADRTRHHYFDPLTQKGLAASGALRAFGYLVLDAFEMGGTLAGIITGANFNLTGM